MGRIVNRRTLLAAAVLIAAAILLPPFVNISRFKPRIADALSRSLGRRVTIGDVRLRMFPAPGLNLSNVQVEDDPSYSEEPLLRADVVTASLRLTSLWRGRLEIARLSFQYPSLNVVRRADGHWNLESLFERARQVPVAPTSKRTAGQRLRFPYIECETGRVNLKFGREKTVYALTEADLAVWIEREDEWNLRLAARAIRTDANLNDTGEVKLSGTVRRANSLTEMPLDLHVSLDRAQLGQLTTLIYGRDRGWRGTVNVRAALTGTPGALKVQTDTSVDDFRRYDIATRGNMRLASSCTAAFSTTSQQLSDIQCQSPVGNGTVDTHGNVAGLFPVRSYEFSVTARELPASALATLVRHMKKDLPEDVSAEGMVNAQFAVRRVSGEEPVWSGTGIATALALQSSKLDDPLTIRELHFGLPVAATPVLRSQPAVALREGLVIDAFSIDLAGATPARVQAVFSRTGYRIGVNGDTSLQRLLRVSEALGVAAPRFAPEGTANVDLSVTGEWAGFAQPLVLGTAKVKATAVIAGIKAPVQVSSAVLKLAADSVSVQDLAFGWPQADIRATGSMQLPRHCTTIETCPVQFQLHTDSVAIEDVNALLNPAAEKRPWYSIISAAGAKPPMLTRVRASGTLTVGTLKTHGIAAKNVAAVVALDHGKLTAHNVSATALGGKMTGVLQANFNVAPPTYEIKGRLDGGSIATLSGPLRQSWGTGKLDAMFDLASKGVDLATLISSANGKIQYVWRDGTFAMGLDGGAGPLRIHDFRGTAALNKGALSFDASKMQSASGIYIVSGTASLDRQLGLTLARGKVPAYQISGTLEKPKVTPTPPLVPQTQAQLHP